MVNLTACAGIANRPPRAARSSYECMQAVLKQQLPPDLPDKRAHCLAGGLIARYCSITEAYLAGASKEVRDLLSQGDAEWRDWRADRLLRRLEAMMIVADRKSTFLLSGTGDLIEPDDGIVAVGSGGPFAMAAARALSKHSTLSARQIAEEAMNIAADICIYTNPHLTIEEL